MSIKAFPYIWDPKEPTAHPGIALSNRRGRYPRVFLRNKAEAHALVQEIVDLALDPKTWENPNN